MVWSSGWVTPSCGEQSLSAGIAAPVPWLFSVQASSNAASHSVLFIAMAILCEDGICGGCNGNLLCGVLPAAYFSFQKPCLQVHVPLL